jgi:hypothetical protein
MFVLAVCSAVRLTSSISRAADFERDYQHAGALSVEEEFSVLRLVQKIGITNVAKIYTYHVLPSSERGIGLIEGDTVVDQLANYRFVFIEYKSWNPELIPKKSAITEGAFWISSVSEEKRLLCKIAGKTYRVQPIGTVSAKQASRCLSSLLTGQFDTEEGVNRSELQVADFDGRLTITRKGTEKYEFGCDSKTNFTYRYAISLKTTGGGLRVSNIKKWQIPIP